MTVDELRIRLTAYNGDMVVKTCKFQQTYDHGEIREDIHLAEERMESEEGVLYISVYKEQTRIIVATALFDRLTKRVAELEGELDKQKQLVAAAATNPLDVPAATAAVDEFDAGGRGEKYDQQRTIDPLYGKREPVMCRCGEWEGSSACIDNHRICRCSDCR